MKVLAFVKKCAAKARDFAVGGALALAMIVGGAMHSGLALAQTGGSSFAAQITPQIDTSKSDIITIGGAVLVLLVIVAAIAWVSRAMKK